ncbi:Rsp5p-dependent ubiquitination, sorting of cargo proteins at the multivesicular body [Entomortierella beljakovae]|nr:Rsp5p-dependent ubiquitination, sorting of cargo proteins at the multivesicular body [Entomortierella beljakovae]
MSLLSFAPPSSSSFPFLPNSEIQQQHDYQDSIFDDGSETSYSSPPHNIPFSEQSEQIQQQQQQEQQQKQPNKLVQDKQRQNQQQPFKLYPSSVTRNTYNPNFVSYTSTPYSRPTSAPPRYPPSIPERPTIPDSDDDDLAWLIIFLVSVAVIITIATAIRSCGQKAGWLTGSSSPTRRNGSSSGNRDHGRGSRRGMIHQVPDWEEDPEATEERLAALSDTERQAYDAAQAFQIVYPPNSVPTEISLSQYLSIQEKGVSAWEFEASYDHQLYVHDRTELSFFDQTACVQTNLPLPKQQEVYYWEVKMFEKSPNTIVSVGVSTKPYPTTRLPGWNRHSVGYFSNTGRKNCNSLWNGSAFGPIYFEGDVIGCGYRPRNGTVFFTRNGKRIDEAYTGFGRMNLFPTVGATGPCVLHVNFGQSGFVFVEANVKKWGLAPASGTLAPPPAYGSELGSILLEASGSVVSNQSPVVSGRRAIMQSSTRNQIGNGIGRESSSQGMASSRGDGQQGDSENITQISTSLPPPDYSSLDRHGNPRNNIHRYTSFDHLGLGDSDRASVASTESDESVTLLLGDAQPDLNNSEGLDEDSL